MTGDLDDVPSSSHLVNEWRIPAAADEVFTCSTARGVLPVREVSCRLIANPNGPVTRAIDEA